MNEHLLFMRVFGIDFTAILCYLMFKAQDFKNKFNSSKRKKSSVHKVRKFHRREFSVVAPSQVKPVITKAPHSKMFHSVDLKAWVKYSSFLWKCHSTFAWISRTVLVHFTKHSGLSMKAIKQLFHIILRRNCHTSRNFKLAGQKSSKIFGIARTNCFKNEEFLTFRVRCFSFVVVPLRLPYLTKIA